MENRLRQQLVAQEATYAAQKQEESIKAHLQDAGDAFELAARVALGSFDARVNRIAKAPNDAYEEDSQFELGYRVAAEELAVVLRALRKGHPPDPNELDEAIARAWSKHDDG